MTAMKWTDLEVDILKKNYLDWTVPIEEIAEMLGRTYGSITAKARDLGIRRPLPTYLHHGGGGEGDDFSS